MLRRPPPTVTGMRTCSAVRRTTSSMVLRRSYEAVMSRKTSSSAPSALYCAASSTGSPASRRFTKLMPLTTRPSFTSRQGIMRRVSIHLLLAQSPAQPLPDRLHRYTALCRSSRLMHPDLLFVVDPPNDTYH